MANEKVEKPKADQSDSELELKAEENYREFLCREEYKGKECGFHVRAKTDDEVIEHARMHQEIAHGVKEISPDLEKKIKESIRPVSSDGHQF
jgi:predicted small metal-binding protein